MNQRPWCYFGCGSDAGHYIFPEGSFATHGYGRPLFEKMNSFDGKLAPLPERELYLAAFNVIGSIGYSALSWWDRSVDKRPGSNSTIFSPSFDISADDLLIEGERRFPWVFARLPQRVQIVRVPSEFH